MKISELIKPLFESPLPEDWDSSIYSDRIPFTQRVRYAKERAEQVGRGSSRVAFKIPYQGRATVLKIAMNQKGAAQNEEEARLMDDRYLSGLEITIPLIDYDEAGAYPTWIHTEFAEPITKNQLKRFFGGVDINNIIWYLDQKRSGYRGFRRDIELPAEIHDNEYFSALQYLVINFDMPAGDFSRKANWGIYKGRPVIIDLGYTNESMKLNQR